MTTPARDSRSLSVAALLAASALAFGAIHAAEHGVAVAPGDASKAATAQVAVRGAVISTGFERGAYSALVQIAVDGSPLGGATWRLGAKHLSPDGKKELLSGQIDVAEPRTPAVFEIEVALAPGQHVLTLEAEESTGGQKASGRMELSLPDPAGRFVTLSPVAIVQPAAGVFSRAGEVRSRGALARVPGEAVFAELHAALVSVVCRAPGSTAVEVHRELEGNADLQFDAVILPADGEPCAQIRDLIPPGTLTAGSFRYEVVVVYQGARIPAGVREFDAVATGAPLASSGRK